MRLPFPKNKILACIGISIFHHPWQMRKYLSNVVTSRQCVLMDNYKDRDAALIALQKSLEYIWSASRQLYFQYRLTDIKQLVKVTFYAKNG